MLREAELASQQAQSLQRRLEYMEYRQTDRGVVVTLSEARKLAKLRRIKYIKTQKGVVCEPLADALRFSAGSLFSLRSSVRRLAIAHTFSGTAVRPAARRA